MVVFTNQRIGHFIARNNTSLKQQHYNTLASSHALRACNEAFFFTKKKKNSMSLFYIYNFYFENLIYKWIKQFEN